MESTERKHVSAVLEQAGAPEDIFGELQGTQEERMVAARKVFLHIAKVVHPDSNGGGQQEPSAGEAFKRLFALWELAQAKIEAGTYGQKDAAAAFVPFIIQTARCQYTLERLLTHGDLCVLYIGTMSNATGKKRVLLKMPIQAQDNDLVAHEARMLQHLCTGDNYPLVRHFVSQYLDAFPYEELATGIVRQVTVLSYIHGLFSLKEVKEAYPDGVDAKDMAWIWRRLLIALDFAHTNAIIHGSVLPTHILIHPEQHGVVLIDWSYAVFQPAVTHSWVSAISSAYRDWYPVEVFAKEEPQPGLDICMAAKCMIELLGGDPHQRTLPARVPWQIQSYLQGCTVPHPDQRPQDARALLASFDELLERLWGPRTFHAFSMPRR